MTSFLCLDLLANTRTQQITDFDTAFLFFCCYLVFCLQLLFEFRAGIAFLHPPALTKSTSGQADLLTLFSQTKNSRRQASSLNWTALSPRHSDSRVRFVTKDLLAIDFSDHEFLFHALSLLGYVSNDLPNPDFLFRWSSSVTA